MVLFKIIQVKKKFNLEERKITRIQPHDEFSTRRNKQFQTLEIIREFRSNSGWIRLTFDLHSTYIFCLIKIFYFFQWLFRTIKCL